MEWIFGALLLALAVFILVRQFRKTSKGGGCGCGCEGCNQSCDHSHEK